MADGAVALGIAARQERRRGIARGGHGSMAEPRTGRGGRTGGNGLEAALLVGQTGANRKKDLGLLPAQPVLLVAVRSTATTERVSLRDDISWAFFFFRRAPQLRQFGLADKAGSFT